MKKVFTVSLILTLSLSGTSQASWLADTDGSRCKLLLGVHPLWVYGWNEYFGLQQRVVFGSPSPEHIASATEYMDWRLHLIANDIVEDELPNTDTVAHVVAKFPMAKYEYYQIDHGDFFKNAIDPETYVRHAQFFWAFMSGKDLDDLAQLVEPHGRAAIIDTKLKRQVVNVGDFVIVDRKSLLAVGVIEKKSGGFRGFSDI